jgi:hypothetical protein
MSISKSSPRLTAAPVPYCWLRNPAVTTALLVFGLVTTHSCTSTEDDSNGGTPATPGDGYELVIVDGSAVSAADTLGTQTASAPEETDSGQNDLAGAVVFDRDGEFTVQIGIYVGPRDARERVLELSKLGYPAYALKIPGDSRVRVRIGYFSLRKDADLFGRIFKEDTGSEYWVDRRDNETP